MPKVAILYIALGRYIVFWKDFYESCEKYLNPCEKHYFVWTDNAAFEYSDNPNVTVIHTEKRGWPYDSLMRFQMFSDQATQLKKFDYCFFFNANMEFIAPVDLAEIAPAPWHDGLVAGLHPGHYGDICANQPDMFPYERRPESTAYIPMGTRGNYVCGAFNGGTSAAFLEMCKTLAKNVDTDLKKDIVARVDDESHLNAYMIGKKYLLAGRAYGYPEGRMKHLKDHERVLVKIISRHKESPKYGGRAWLRGQTDRRTPNNWFTRNIMRRTCWFCGMFIPNQKVRRRIRGLYG